MGAPKKKKELFFNRFLHRNQWNYVSAKNKSGDAKMQEKAKNWYW